MRTLLITIVVSSFLAVTALGCGKDKAADPAPAAEKAEPAKKGEAKKAEPKKEEAKKAEAKKAAPAAADGKPSAADCKAACDNMAKLLMASLPADTPAEVKAEAAKGLAACPGECVKESTAAEVKCLAAAKTQADMEKCAGDE